MELKSPIEKDLIRYSRSRNKAYNKEKQNNKRFYEQADKDLKSMFTNFFQSFTAEDKTKYDVDSKIKLLKEKKHTRSSRKLLHKKSSSNTVQQIISLTPKHSNNNGNNNININNSSEYQIKKIKTNYSLNKTRSNNNNNSNSGNNTNNVNLNFSSKILHPRATKSATAHGLVELLQKEEQSLNANISDSQNCFFKDKIFERQTTQPLQRNPLFNNEEKNIKEILTQSMNFNKHNYALMTILPFNMLPVDNEKDYEKIIKESNKTINSYNTLCQDLKNSLIYTKQRRKSSFILNNSNRSSRSINLLNVTTTNNNNNSSPLNVNGNDTSFTKSAQYLKHIHDDIYSPKHELVRTIIGSEIGMEPELPLTIEAGKACSYMNLTFTDKEDTLIIDEENNKHNEQEILFNQFNLQNELPLLEYQYRKYLTTNIPVYDSLSDIDGYDEAGTVFIIPESKFKLILDFFVLITTLYFVCFSPVEFAFIQSFKDRFSLIILFNCIGEIIYIVDFIAGFLTAYYDTIDHLNKKTSAIINHYLCTWFTMDLLTALPCITVIDLYLVTNTQSTLYITTFNILTYSNLKYIHCFKLLKVFKIIKVSISNAVMTYLLDKAALTSFGKSVLLYITMFAFFISLHIMASFFIFLGYNNFPSWITNQGLRVDEYFTIYFASVYFVMVTIVSVGYGDILSTNFPERCFLIFLLVIGVLVYTWFISAFSKNREESIVEGGKADKCLKKIEYLETLNDTYSIPFTLYDLIYRYLMFNFQKEKLNIDIILCNLPSTLQRELLFAMYKPTVSKFVFFKYFDNEDFMMKVLTCLKRSFFYKNERLIHKGDFVEEMLFVQKGALALELPLPNDLSNELVRTQLISEMAFRLSSKNTLNTGKDKVKKVNPFQKKIQRNDGDQQYIKLIEIRTNEHYGDLSIFLNQRSILSVRVSSKVAQLFYLKKQDAFAISTQFPEIWRAIIINSIYNMKQINVIIERTIMFFYQHNKKIRDTLLIQNASYNEEMRNKENELLRKKGMIMRVQHKEDNNNVDGDGCVNKNENENENVLYGEGQRQINLMSEASAAGLLSGDGEHVLLSEEEGKVSSLLFMKETKVNTILSGKKTVNHATHNNMHNESSTRIHSSNNSAKTETANGKESEYCFMLSNNDMSSQSVSSISKMNKLCALSNKSPNKSNCTELNNATDNVNQTPSFVKNTPFNSNKLSSLNEYFFPKTSSFHPFDLMEINEELEQGELLQVKPSIQTKDEEPIQPSTKNANELFVFKRSEKKNIKHKTVLQREPPSKLFFLQHSTSKFQNTNDDDDFNTVVVDRKNSLRQSKIQRSDLLSSARNGRGSSRRVGLSKLTSNRNELKVNMNHTGIAEFDTSLKLVLPKKFSTSKGLTEVRHKKCKKGTVDLIETNIELSLQNLNNPEKFYETQFLDMINNQGKMNKEKNKVGFLK